MTTALVVGLGLVTALLAVLVAGLLRSHAEILRALHELGVNLDPNEEHDHGDVAVDGPRPMAAGVPGQRPSSGTRGVDVDGLTPSGAAVHVGVLGARTPTLLAFLSSSCLTCRTFWTEFSAPVLDVPHDGRIVAVTQGPDRESPSQLAELAPPGITTVMSTEAWMVYDVPGAPYFVLVDPSGTVLGEGAATTWARVRDLLGRAQADALHLGQRDRELLVDATLERAGIDASHPTVRPVATPPGTEGI